MSLDYTRMRAALEEGAQLSGYLDELVREAEPDVTDDQARLNLRRRLTITSTFYSDMANGPVLWPPMGLSLPGKPEIGSVYIENHGSAAAINVFAGSAGGQLIRTVSKGTFGRLVVQDGIDAIYFTTTAVDSGLVQVTLSTHRWGPSYGTII